MTRRIKPETNGTVECVDVESLKFWRSVARGLLPKEDDDWHLGELATALRLLSELVGQHWTKASSLADKNENNLSTIGFSVTVNRKEAVPVVKVSLGYAERFSGIAESEVPDPAQTELPGILKEA